MITKYYYQYKLLKLNKIDEYFKKITYEISNDTKLYWKEELKYCLNGDIKHEFIPVGNTNVQKISYTYQSFPKQAQMIYREFYILDNNDVSIYWQHDTSVNNIDDAIIRCFRKLYLYHIEENIRESSIIGFTNNLITNFI